MIRVFFVIVQRDAGRKSRALYCHIVTEKMLFIAIAIVKHIYYKCSETLMSTSGTLLCKLHGTASSLISAFLHEPASEQ